MAVVKSDAYGHGAAGTAELLEAAGADWLGVASIDEGVQVRERVNIPILILSPTPSWAITTALENRLDITVTSPKQIQDVAQAASSGKIKLRETRARIHLKVDTGMHRLGVNLSELPAILDLIGHHDGELELVSVFSHLARADHEESVLKQQEVFEKAIDLSRKRFPETFYHLASSEATRRFQFTHYDMVRVGLYIYGLEPNTVSKQLHPALSVRARINHKAHIGKGESVGYGWTWTAQRDTDIASIPVGYADGIDRGLSNSLQGLLMGRRISQIGRISMDQMLFDITDVPEAQEGDVITILGAEQGQGLVNATAQSTEENSPILLSSWAQTLDTITYELACRLRARLPRVYTRSRPRS